MLEAAREAAPGNIPVLGVNYGRLGFLCEVERGEIYSALKKVLRKDYVVEERLMMLASLNRSGERQQFLVLNDVVFCGKARMPWSRSRSNYRANRFPVLHPTVSLWPRRPGLQHILSRQEGLLSVPMWKRFCSRPWLLMPYLPDRWL